MRLIYLHGPPASGKYTVGEALRAEIGTRNFHNHVTIDVAKTLFDFGTEPFWALVRTLRIASLTAAAGHPELTAVFTSCYSHPRDLPTVHEIEALVTRPGGVFVPVFLECEQAELERRVMQPSRADMNKLRSIDGLHARQRQWNCVPLPHPECRTLVTQGKTPAQCARELIDALGLRGP